MKINFELAKKDILAFHLYLIFHNKGLRVLYLLNLLMQVFFSFGSLFRWIIFQNGLQNSERELIVFVIGQALVSFAVNILVCLGIFVVLNAIYIAFQMMKYKHNDGTLGAHLIELRENNLLEATDVNETVHSWKSVQKIIEWRNYILIYVSATNAHIIPKRSFSSLAEEKLFIDEANRLKELSKSNFSPSYLASNS